MPTESLTAFRNDSQEGSPARGSKEPQQLSMASLMETRPYRYPLQLHIITVSFTGIDAKDTETQVRRQLCGFAFTGKHVTLLSIRFAGHVT